MVTGSSVQLDEPPSYWKTSSTFTPKAAARRKASSRDGTYLPASRAMIVWRVTPTRSARACWVISPWSKRSRRIRFWSFSSFLPGIPGPSGVLGQGGDGRQRPHEHETAEDTPTQHAHGHGPILSVNHGRENHSSQNIDHPEHGVCQKPGSSLDKLVPLVGHYLAWLLA